MSEEKDKTKTSDNANRKVLIVTWTQMLRAHTEAVTSEASSQRPVQKARALI